MLLTACSSSPLQENTIDVLFIAYDQGESSAFLHIEKALAAQGLSFRVLALGRGAIIYNNHPETIPLPVNGNVAALTHERAHLLAPSYVTTITKKWHPHIVYTGMASAVQAQLANAFHQQGSAVFAFYDNFDSAGNMPYIQPFLNNIETIDELQVPSPQVRESFQRMHALKQTPMSVVGQPALEEWDVIFNKTNEVNLRRTLGLKASDTVILFAGGNINDDYKNGFKHFVSTAARLPDAQFLVTWHPKFDGQFEADTVRSAGSKNIQLVGQDRASTAQLSKVADIVATHQSTVGAKALYKEKPVIYFTGEDYSNFLIQAGLATRASNTDAAVVALNRMLEKTNTTASLLPLGMPAKPSEVVAESIRDFLNDKYR